MKRHTTLALVLATLLIAGHFPLYAQEESKPAPKPESKAPNWYRIELTLNEFQDGKKTNTRSYTLEGEENSGASSSMKLGDRVPITAGGSQYQYIDVGLHISSRVLERQGRLALFVLVDQSSIVSPAEELRAAQNQPMIRQLKMENTAFVTLGKPILVASVDDPSKANHKYTVEATVTKLNP